MNGGHEVDRRTGIRRFFVLGSEAETETEVGAEGEESIELDREAFISSELSALWCFLPSTTPFGGS
jgi:hypothetical protein